MVVIGSGIDRRTIFEDFISEQNLLVLSENCLYLSILQNMYRSLSITHGEIIEVGDSETLIQFAMMGMGITLVSTN